MNDKLIDTKDFLQRMSDDLHFLIAQNFPDSWVLFFQIAAKFFLLALLVYLLDFVLKIIINSIFLFFKNQEKYPILNSIRKARVTNSIAHLIALGFGSYALKSIFWRHPKSFVFLERTIDFALVLVIAGLAFRSLKALEYYNFIKKDYYKNFALRTISETVKIIGTFIFSVIGICVIFGINSATILGSLGALTAVMVLVFRDTILGFITGIHVATSKNLKSGDWIGIPKYNIEGNVEDIGLLTTKIVNFDKTVSTIPTYDLMTTEIRNYQIMTEGNLRRIKRSIIFNIKSFRFLKDEDLDRLQTINLISEYLTTIRKEIEIEKRKELNPDKIINGKQLTNIGVFRKYVENYLKINPYIEQRELLLVRQLEITPQGMPLEIYCFTIFSALAEYEEVQADIFDHLLVAAQEFDLEIMQVKV